jgi:thymidine phosphorylase
MPATDLSISTILAATRDGRPLHESQIEFLVAGILSGEVTRAQAAAWLAFVYHQGLTDSGTIALTRAITASGDQLSWVADGRPVVDKHSTGGVGDKVSLVLAPLWAELGLRVPMISGRGLEHTGGTLDKLESIPGFRVDHDIDRLRAILADVGCFISGQTTELAPADRFLYALRDETHTVASIPLITSSILGKKLAEGLDRLVLDVKFGAGAFLKTRPQAQTLADTMVAVANGMGTDTRAVLSPMHEPLGHAVGNAIEVEEAIQCLQGDGPSDLHALVVALADHPDADRVLRSGCAYERFCRMARAQGGDPTAALLGGDGLQKEVFVAPHSGIVLGVDALSVGKAAFRLGAGRTRAGDAIHPGVGVRVHVKVGDAVERGQPIYTLLHAEEGLVPARALLGQGLDIGTDIQGEPTA